MRVALLATGLAACGKSDGSATCGIASLTGPLVVKESFGKGNSLSRPPEQMPPTIHVRLVAGPAFLATVEPSDSGGWLVKSGTRLSPLAKPGYGVLIVDFHGVTQGVLVFDGRAVAGAPDLGRLAIGDTVLPLLGVSLDPTTMEDPKCPVFPDSTR